MIVANSFIFIGLFTLVMLSIPIMLITARLWVPKYNYLSSNFFRNIWYARKDLAQYRHFSREELMLIRKVRK